MENYICNIVISCSQSAFLPKCPDITNYYCFNLFALKFTLCGIKFCGFWQLHEVTHLTWKYMQSTIKSIFIDFKTPGLPLFNPFLFWIPTKYWSFYCLRIFTFSEHHIIGNGICRPAFFHLVVDFEVSSMSFIGLTAHFFLLLNNF